MRRSSVLKKVARVGFHACDIVFASYGFTQVRKPFPQQPEVRLGAHATRDSGCCSCLEDR